VPAALGADVASVTGIDQTVPPATNSAAENAALSPVTGQAKAASAAASTADGYQCSQYWGQHTEKILAAYGRTSAPTQLCGYTRAQLRKAYGITGSRYTGKGATIAVVLNEAWPTMLADANKFFAANGIAGFAPGSGGGISVFAEPGYQEPVVPATLATDGGASPAHRVVPDISADAGNNWLIGYTGALGQQGVYSQDNEGGGTSGASPLIAGLEADAMQAAGHPLGFANPALYLLAKTPAIHDVPAVNPSHPPMVVGGSLETGVSDDYLTTMGEDTPPLQAAAGYDDVTGLGAPGPSFVTAFSGL
jgi:subtilase family serine protease